MTLITSEGAGVILDVRSLSKTFAATRALDRVDISVSSGEVVALCGQNGSGKSTLIKVLAGYHEADPGGEILVHGEAFDPRRAYTPSLRFIHQDLALVNTLSAVENLALSRRADQPSLFPNRTRREIAAARETLARLGVEIPLTVPIGRLSQAERTMVAIARAIEGWEREDSLLVLDEPTASLHERETRLLFTAVRALVEKGAGVLFVSHRLNEVQELADRAVVLRDGSVAAALDGSEVTAPRIVAAMLGERVSEVQRSSSPADRVVLSVKGVAGHRVRHVNFQVRAGEILGVSGLIGSGAETLGSIVAGGRVRTAGVVRVDGTVVRSNDISTSIRRGLAWAPSERQTKGLVMTHSVRENITLPLLSSVTDRFASIRRRLEKADAHRWIQRLHVRPDDTDAFITQLSGGNQQKVVLAKWLRTNPSVLWLDEPTQGVDVGAKAAIHQLIADAADAEKAVIIASTDSAELVALCDRVLVFDDGRVIAELSGDDLTEQRLLTESAKARSALHRQSAQEHA